MSSYLILIVDDEPDIRKVVERSLARDPQFATRTCASGQEALAAAAEWLPDLIILDFMMPVMDGPTTLARLRENPLTATIPVVFLTARATTQELEYAASLGVSGAIAKPFEPKALRESVRDYLHDARPSEELGEDALSDRASAAEQEKFRQRLRSDAIELGRLRAKLRSEAPASATLDELRSVVHKLAGAGGIFGFEQLSRSAAALEKSIVEAQSGPGNQCAVEANLNLLIEGIARMDSKYVVHSQLDEFQLRGQPAFDH
jgi:CheY-like chemotaxis protein